MDRHRTYPVWCDVRNGCRLACAREPSFDSAGRDGLECVPMLPTHVIGSHGFPGWFWTALDRIKAGDYGQTDVKEAFDDATQLAIRDQERAGVDILCDGEMRRFFFVQTFYERMQGLEPLEPLRKTGLYAYDSVPRYRATSKIRIDAGL